METKAIAAQSLFDLALQLGGSVESVFALALQNDLSITAEIEAGQPLELAKARNADVVDYYRVRNIKPAAYSGQEILKLTGIGYMAIEEDFIVS